jgi:hypothetical protein
VWVGGPPDGRVGDTLQRRRLDVSDVAGAAVEPEPESEPES